MTSFKEFLEEQLLDEEFATNYDEVSAEMDFALAVVLRREKLGLTQQELAEKTGMKQPMLARIEGGQMPTPRTLQRLAKGLKVGVLFNREGVFPEHRRPERPTKDECDYTLLVRASSLRQKEKAQKEKVDATLATAA